MSKVNNFISRGVLNKTFPFFITVDKSCVVRDAGKSLLKLMNDIIGKRLSEFLKIDRPHNLSLNFESLIGNEGKLILCSLKLPTGKAFYKGQVLQMEKGRRLVIFGSLFLTDPDDLNKHGLVLPDFSISDASSDMLQLIQVNRMVTDDLQRLNEILREKERKYSKIIEQADEIIFTTDLNGVFTFMNDVGIKLMGLQNEDITKVSFEDVIDTNYIKEIKQIGNELLKGDIHSGYVEFLLKDKSVWIGQNMTMSDDTGQKGFQGISRDITETKKYQELLMTEREKATQAAKSKSRFLANMSHEIRTPLNGIMGLTNLLLNGNASDQEMKYLEAIKSSSETLMVVINDILDLSKMESGKMDIRKEPFDLKIAISQLIEIMDSKALEKNLQLSFDYDMNIPGVIIGDEARLNQMLYNLVGNAIKFTKEGGVSVDTKLIQQTEEKVLLSISVTDTGIGISEDKIGNIFRAFRQIDDADSRDYEGTGLGLTITKRLVELMHGEILATSTLGQGSCFSVQIPFKTGDKATNEIKIQEEKQLADLDLDSAKILVAEDNPINQMVTIDVLKDFGISVDLAENGKEAVEMMRSNEYDVIMMDMQMPVMDGYEAMRIIKGEFRKKVKIIALTAHVTEGEIKRCKDSGADEYMSKPFNPKELVERLNALYHGIEQKGGRKQVNKGVSQELDADDVIDFSVLKNFTQGNEKLMASTLELLKNEIPRDIDLIKEQVAQSNFTRIKALAHRAGPNFKLVCSEQYAKMILEIEQEASKAESIYKIDDCIGKLELICPQVLTGIDEQLNKLKTT